MVDQWVLVGVRPFSKERDYHVVGPFDTADDAREAANVVGIPEFGWEVVRLSPLRASS